MGSAPEILDQQPFPAIIQTSGGSQVFITSATWINNWSEPTDGVTTIGKPTPILSDELGFPEGVYVNTGA